jgi:hypothetical protein
MDQTYPGIVTRGTKPMRPRRPAEQELSQPAETETVVSLAEDVQSEDAQHPVDENFGKYPYDRFRDAAEGRVSARDYARDLLRHVGLGLS